MGHVNDIKEDKLLNTSETDCRSHGLHWIISPYLMKNEIFMLSTYKKTRTEALAWSKHHIVRVGGHVISMNICPLRVPTYLRKFIRADRSVTAIWISPHRNLYKSSLSVRQQRFGVCVRNDNRALLYLLNCDRPFIRGAPSAPASMSEQPNSLTCDDGLQCLRLVTFSPFVF